jgi:putative polyketide hydroxylase
MNDGLALGYAYGSSVIAPDGSAPPSVDDPIADYAPCARPGHRAPHIWLRRAGQPISTLDLFGPHFTLLTAADGDGQRNPYTPVPDLGGVPVQVHAIGPGAQLGDDDCTWATT